MVVVKHQPAATLPATTNPLIDVRIASLHYGTFKALGHTHIPIHRGTITAFIGPSDRRQEHGPALPQPDERSGAGLPIRG